MPLKQPIPPPIPATTWPPRSRGPVRQDISYTGRQDKSMESRTGSLWNP